MRVSAQQNHLRGDRPGPVRAARISAARSWRGSAPGVGPRSLPAPPLTRGGPRSMHATRLQVTGFRRTRLSAATTAAQRVTAEVPGLASQRAPWCGARASSLRNRQPSTAVRERAASIDWRQPCPNAVPGLHMRAMRSPSPARDPPPHPPKVLKSEVCTPRSKSVGYGAPNIACFPHISI